MRPPRFELGTLGLEIPCSIHLSYGRERGFCVSGPPLLSDLLGAGPGNPIFYHGRRGGAACPVECTPARIGRPLRVGSHIVAERGLYGFVPHELLEIGWCRRSGEVARRCPEPCGGLRAWLGLRAEYDHERPGAAPAGVRLHRGRERQWDSQRTPGRVGSCRSSPGQGHDAGRLRESLQGRDGRDGGDLGGVSGSPIQPAAHQSTRPASRTCPASCR